MPRQNPSPASANPAFSGESIQAGRSPLYISLAKALIQDIETGRYALNSLLPTEGEMAQRYGVSRHTVRQALRELKEQGLVLSRPGIGTRVRSRPEAPRFFSGINNISDLLQFVGTTEMHVISHQEIVADEESAAQLRCPPGLAWHRTDIVRKVPGRALPLCYLQAYVRPEFSGALRSAKIIRKPIYSLIETRYGLRIVEVVQEITAANLDSNMAHSLKAEDGQAALKISRYYFDKNGTIVEVGIGYYPSGRYTQSSKFRAGNDGS
ncbi:GntR family transcriptional regulator [Candidimonas humi]|uniref:GntR family transcriptional regulator n=1 Tax=Candidimonas humi TaxID=683355 RepID=A0ABV8NXQ4_9BURK|nr:GntR family transcriptional regulator [Candidimonas humi]MBV6304504.1 GntR family transcriptional regulator [Candidimonas humi]